MFKNRPSWFYGILVTALFGPYVALDKNLGGALLRKVQDLAASTSAKPAEPATPTQNPLGSSAQDASLTQRQNFSRTLLHDVPLCDIPEALRFDISPEWVTTRWPRVTTVLAETDLQGLRVPLITGTRPDDLAGSLTYYFDKQHKVQRISFQGTTGDERRLVAIVTKGFGLKAVPSLEAGLFMTSHNGQPLSTLRVTWPPVISVDQPLARCEVLLEINRLDAQGSSPRLQQILTHDRQLNRW